MKLIAGPHNDDRNHALRVLKNLDLMDQFCGMTYCNYMNPNIRCKPETEFFDIAMRAANMVGKPKKCLLGDDSSANCAIATGS